MPKSARKTRERQLAKLAARRAAQRKRKRRQRIVATGVGLFLVVALVTGLGVAFLTGGNAKTVTKPSATPTPTPTASPGGVACGAEVPEGAFVDRPTFKKAPALTIVKSKTYTARVKTSCGTIELKLFSKEAPLAVNNFVFLAKKHFYDGLTFHRIVPNFVIQGGDPKGTGEGGPGYSFKDELKNDLKYKLGTLAMANSGVNTNGSQFFIVAGSEGTTLPKNYTIFGEVTKGMDVVAKIDALPTVGGTDPSTHDKPLQAVYIDTITIKVS